MFNAKVFLAEFVGAFALAFVGMSAGIVNAGLVGIALAFGLTQAVLHLAYGRISGAHFNPAITFGVAFKGGGKFVEGGVFILCV
jgi:aquaporin Z